MMVLRFLTALVTCFALTAPASALDLSKMTQAEQDAFGAAVREYLMQNPQVIMDAVAVLEARQAQQQETADLQLVAQNKTDLFDDGYSYVGGNPDGDITLVEFLDYRCGYCRRAHPEVTKLLESDGNIRLIVKEFPILGDQSVLASRFAIATRQLAGNDAYKLISDTLIEYSGEITMPALARMARTLDLDGKAIEAQMASRAVSDELRATRALAQRMKITGTPTFVLQDEMLRGYLPYDQLRAIIKEKRG